MTEKVDSDRRAEIETIVSFLLAGRLEEAERSARRLHEADGNDETALHLLAQSLYRQGRCQEALDSMSGLLQLSPGCVGYHNELGVFLAALERWAEAESAHRMALVLDPASADARFNLALMLFRQGKHVEALSELDVLETYCPDHVERHILRAEILLAEGQLLDAFLSVEAALEAGYGDLQILVSLAAGFVDAGSEKDAERILDKALQFAPRNATLKHFVGKLFRSSETTANESSAASGDVVPVSGQFVADREALPFDSRNDPSEAEIRHDPEIAAKISAVYSVLGNCYHNQGRMQDALACFHKSVELDPVSHVAWNNLGELCIRLRRLDEAESACRQVLSLKPDDTKAALNLGILLLLRGDFENGWKYYEKRWEMPLIRANRPRFQQPEWLGEPLDGKTLLIYVEQGMGDNLQFVRYLKVLRERYPTARIFYWGLRPLFRLFSAYAAECGVELLPEVVPGGLPPIDYHVALLTIPERVGTTLATIPADVPYLRAPAELVERWRQRLVRLAGKRIGLVWTSGETYHYHRSRSMQLAQFRPLFEIEGISWVSLQKGSGQVQIVEEGLQGRILDLMDEVEDFADTAAIIANLDLVISVDTSVPHLAGAMGVPVWLMDRFDTNWRWLLDRADSPWYPTMQIFRQTAFGDWDPVVSRVAEALDEWVAGVSVIPAENHVADRRDVSMENAMITDSTVKALKLNLGCGNRKMGGFINVDFVEACRPDLVVNLEKTPWPWGDNTVDEIKLIHVLEHLGQSTDIFLSIIKEIYRVCRDGANIEIIVPHPRSDHYLGDPTHVRPVTIAMLNLFDQRLNREWEKMDAANTPLGMILGVDFEVESAEHTLEPEWQHKLSSGQMNESAIAEAIRQFNNVVVQTKIVWRVRKGVENVGRVVDVSTTSSDVDASESERIASECLARGDQESARHHLEHALNKCPERYDLRCLLGVLHQQRGNLAEARDCYERAALRAPPSYELLHNLGMVCLALGEKERARSCFEQALAISPKAFATLDELAELCQRDGDVQGVLSYYEQLLKLDPRHIRAYLGMASTFSNSGWDDDARRLFEAVLTIDSSNLDALNGLAICCKRTGLFDQAFAYYDRALAIMPGSVSVLRNKAMLYADTGDHQAAEETFRKALSIDPNEADAHFGLGCSYLIRGRLLEGWPEYEYRWRCVDSIVPIKPPASELPRWQGEPVDAAASGIVLYAEQGFGDAIQFSRFVPLVASRFNKICLKIQEPLRTLFERSFGHLAKVTSAAPDETGYTHHCPLLSLPLAFNASLDSIPSEVPYMTVDPARSARWRQRLAGRQGVKVGVVWATGKRGMHKADFDVPLALMAPLFSLPEVRWVSLNKTPLDPDQKRVLDASAVVDWTGELDSFDDTAALIANLDLVVSVDTAVAHLAGALGKPVWLLNRGASEWRWLLERSDSPWYPSMRIFRQSEHRQWAPVVDEVSAALRQFIDGRTGVTVSGQGT